MLITAVVETIVLWCCKYRSIKTLCYFFLLNCISNLTLNLTYQHIWMMAPKIILVPLLEFLVYVFETGFLGLATGYNKKLFLCVLLSNIITYSLGVILYGF